MSRAKALAIILALNLPLAAGLVGLGACARDTHERQKVDAFARGYSKGLAEGLASAETAPADPDVSLIRQIEELRSELEAATTCEGRLLDHQRTEAANRENARLLGLDEGLRLSREDWTCQRWECPR